MAPTTTTTTAQPTFDGKDVLVAFVLGGPGSGKGTQCARLVDEYGFVHLSAGDLLREEQARQGSEFGSLIASHIVNGTIVPSEVTIALLRNAMRHALDKRSKGDDVPDKHREKWSEGKGRFLVDGFPRQMDQAHAFDDTVCLSSFVLFLTCTEDVMLERLLQRGKTSGRSDDNLESIKKRFRTFVDTSMPVVDYYRKQDKVIEVDSTQSVDVVTEQIRSAIASRV